MVPACGCLHLANVFFFFLKGPRNILCIPNELVVVTEHNSHGSHKVKGQLLSEKKRMQFNMTEQQQTDAGTDY